MSYSKEINNYLNAIHNIDSHSNERDNERYFTYLLESIIKREKYGYYILSDYDYKTESNTNIRLDAGVFTSVGLLVGIYEAKKSTIDLDKAITEKREAHYPFFNIIFENAKEVILLQNGEEKDRVTVGDKKGLEGLLFHFFSYSSKEIREYNAAQNNFFEQVPILVEAIRKYFDDSVASGNYKKELGKLQNSLQKVIDPTINSIEVREILVQHILTIDIFISVFNESKFIQYNPIAKCIEELSTSILNQGILKSIQSKFSTYTKHIQKTALNITDFNLKKQFLITFYEKFYGAYNPRGADKLGIVYTPEPIVKFMIENTDTLLQKHFDKSLLDKDIDILDPAVGTGNYICSLLEYLFEQGKGKKHLEKVTHKYEEEIWCHEVSILPYYIASLKIEQVYHQYTGDYKSYRGIIYQDTLENISYRENSYDRLVIDNKQLNLFGEHLSKENTDRKAEENQKKMTVIIGNPPYNANQQNYNNNNANKKYSVIDKRIQESYIKNSIFKKHNYDMYRHFIRWASDRIVDNGIIAFVTPNGYIHDPSLDGFRKCVGEEFDYIYVIDLGGEFVDIPGRVKNSNVFNIKLGVAITFFIKCSNSLKKQCSIQYIYPYKAYTKKIQKLDYLQNTKIQDIIFDTIEPNVQGYWLDTEESDFNEHLSMASSKTEVGIFIHNNPGVSTNRDHWVYDFEPHTLTQKIKYFISIYNSLLETNQKLANKEKVENILSDNRIKWSTSLKDKFVIIKKMDLFSKKNIKYCYYRPFTLQYLYAHSYFNDRLTEKHYSIFGKDLEEQNLVLNISGVGSSKKFQSLVTNILVNYDFLEHTQMFSLYTYNTTQEDNISHWALEQFKNHYRKKITKEDIFYYVYAVLNTPYYIKKYEIELTRSLPRIPLYSNFSIFVKLGKQLVDLHTNFDTIAPYKNLQFYTSANKKSIKNIQPLLKVDKAEGIIYLDSETKFTGIPQECYDYKLGLRSPIEWVLDQHKLLKSPEKKTEGYTEIYNQFNTPKNEMDRYVNTSKPLLIDLIPRLVSVSLETLNIKKQLDSIL